MIKSVQSYTYSCIHIYLVKNDKNNEKKKLVKENNSNKKITISIIIKKIALETLPTYSIAGTPMRPILMTHNAQKGLLLFSPGAKSVLGVSNLAMNKTNLNVF